MKKEDLVNKIDELLEEDFCKNKIPIRVSNLLRKIRSDLKGI